MQRTCTACTTKMCLNNFQNTHKTGTKQNTKKHILHKHMHKEACMDMLKHTQHTKNNIKYMCNQIVYKILCTNKTYKKHDLNKSLDKNSQKHMYGTISKIQRMHNGNICNNIHKHILETNTNQHINTSF